MIVQASIGFHLNLALDSKYLQQPFILSKKEFHWHKEYNKQENFAMQNKQSSQGSIEFHYMLEHQPLELILHLS